MKSVTLKAFPRTLLQRGGVKKLRTSGRVPAVIYGRQTKPQNLEVGFDEITDLLHHSASENVLLDLVIENDARAPRLALVQEVQHHPLSGDVLHLDLHEIAADEKVTVFVPVETVGEAAGVKNSGGTLDHVMFKLRARGLAKDLPEQIILDVTPLEIGKSIHIGEVVAPAGVEILGEKTRAVVTVAAPRAEEEVAPAATAAVAAAGDVEMTKEKKEDGTEGEGDAKPAKGDAKAAAPAGDKKTEAKPEAKAEKKKK
ncbi:MAG: 50S ribosomal protein L25 [Verrucomicrobiae bacterium]|nr:50S ribosomal protein L25 [Verrucomicrobiae bacterium]